METTSFQGGRIALIDAMRHCPQTPTQSVLAHGEAVWAHFQQLLGHLSSDAALPDWWRVPAWARSPGLLELLAPLDVIADYLIHHDCVI